MFLAPLGHRESWVLPAHKARKALLVLLDFQVSRAPKARKAHKVLLAPKEYKVARAQPVPVAQALRVQMALRVPLGSHRVAPSV